MPRDAFKATAGKLSERWRAPAKGVTPKFARGEVVRVVPWIAHRDVGQQSLGRIVPGFQSARIEKWFEGGPWGAVGADTVNLTGSSFIVEIRGAAT